MSDNFSDYDAKALEFLLSTDELELEETTTNELPFFLSVNHVSYRQPHHAYFKETAMGVNHLYGLTKNMIKSCPSIQDGRKLTNHSARRHLVQKLQDRGVQNAQIMQISGHTNVQSMNTYSRLNQNQ